VRLRERHDTRVSVSSRTLQPDLKAPFAGAIVAPGKHQATAEESQASRQENDVSIEIAIRTFEETDAKQVRQLFILINRLLSPASLRDAFETYIQQSLAEEIDRIPSYYGERDGGFWVALRNDKLVGMFGLERAAPHAMELRRMYVDPAARRVGIARKMLAFAEDECRQRKAVKLELSTSELQQAAIALYRTAGYRLVREAIVETGSNKTVGSGIRRLYFEKSL
jgi:GNAT superfamily N-acetyltransferase